MRYEPGEVWLLPPAEEAGGDPKCRRHVLIVPCGDEGDVGAFAYASTAATEARFGAARLFVDPAVSRSPRVGFTHPSYVYPGRLILAHSEDMLRLTGRLIDEMPQIRTALRQALGLGSARNPPRPMARGWRGRVVRLTHACREAIGYGFGVVVTDPAYSRRERYQIIVPVASTGEFESEPRDLIVSGGDWLRAISPEASEVLAAIGYVQAVFHPLEIEGWTGYVVDDSTMNRIETALVERFDL